MTEFKKLCEHYKPLLENSGTAVEFEKYLNEVFDDPNMIKGYVWSVKFFVDLDEKREQWLKAIIREKHGDELTEYYEKYIAVAYKIKEFGAWKVLCNENTTVEYVEDLINVCENYGQHILRPAGEFLYYLRMTQKGRLPYIYNTAVDLKKCLTRQKFFDCLHNFKEESDNDLDVLFELVKEDLEKNEFGVIALSFIQQEWMNDYKKERKEGKEACKRLCGTTARSIFDKIPYCEKDGKLYRWKGSNRLFGYFVAVTSLEINVRNVYDRLPFSDYKRVFQCDDSVMGQVKRFVSEFKTSGCDPELKPKGHEEIDKYCPKWGHERLILEYKTSKK